MEKNCKAHLIDTKERPQPHKDKWYSSEIITNGKGNIWLDVNKHKTPSSNLGEGFRHQHLYITDDSPSKEGDWCIHIITGKIIQYNSKKHKLSENWKKVIATTDLSMSTPNPSGSKVTIPVPSISQQDIETIVKLYRKEENWEDVKVEYEIITREFPFSKREEVLGRFPKLSPEGNVVLSFEEEIKTFTQDEVITMFGEWGSLRRQQELKGEFKIPCVNFLIDRFGITSHNIPKMYSREEVEVLCKKATLIDNDEFYFDKWIKENL